MNGDTIAVAGMITGILISLGTTAGIILAIYFGVKAKNKERMALIEKGADVSEIYKKREPVKNILFKWGIVIIGISVGLLIGNVIASNTGLDGFVAYSAMILLFGGIGMLVANFLKFDK